MIILFLTNGDSRVDVKNLAVPILWSLYAEGRLNEPSPERDPGGGCTAPNEPPDSRPRGGSRVCSGHLKGSCRIQLGRKVSSKCDVSVNREIIQN
jgi:hypothetical protein